MKRVYISTPLKPEKFKLGPIQDAILKAGVFAFIPTTVDTTPEQGAAINKLQIELADEVWVFGPIGRDCSWEIGYAQGKGIPVVFHESNENKHMVTEDWMLFCAGTQVVRSEFIVHFHTIQSDLNVSADFNKHNRIIKR